KAAPIVAIGFFALIAATAAFSVLHAKDEEEAKAAEFSEANEEITKEEASPVEDESKETPAPKPKPAAKGPGSTLQLAASPTDLAFDTTSLTSKPGKVTIDFDNPAALEHNVAIEQDGKEIAVSETLTEGKTSVSADLAPDTYTFLCTVPGHAEAGMQGTLVVK
ncbi:MAG TPA: plastocyanin/azurin family copper-binding protein, partial [Solirubrobacterales bacterium]